MLMNGTVEILGEKVEKKSIHFILNINPCLFFIFEPARILTPCEGVVDDFQHVALTFKYLVCRFKIIFEIHLNEYFIYSSYCIRMDEKYIFQ